ncbi:MAG TPA: pyridoxal phosphate-dependent aminotransferase [Candidatus Sulfomarinibacteraceae bacterium]|nr:pyridoxal phosphate-dependent aminotransferase [Candidatus Sulfomarinibacteraceae bacterium]
MRIAPFSIEEYFAQHEFNVPYNLCASDCETTTIANLLQMAGLSMDALGELTLGYTESQGHPLLREAIAGSYDQVLPEWVVVLGAPEEGIYITMRTLLEPGDEVIVVTPAYESLYNVAQHICGNENVKAWPIEPQADHWRLSLQALEAQLTARTKMLVVNFPHNPTGYLPARSLFEAIIDLARRHELWLFCDEMYRGLETGDTEQLPSAADHYERAIVLAGLSKVHGLPGLRSGWLVIQDETVRERLINWKHYTTICAPAPSEFLALAALSAQDELVARSRAVLEENLGIAGDFFARHEDKFTWRRPQAGSVALVGVSVTSATDYCRQLITEAGVLLLPGPYLGYDDKHVRFGFGRRDFRRNLQQFEAYLDHETV